MRHDPPALVSRFAQSHMLPLGVAVDYTGQIARAFGDIGSTPTAFVIDKIGRFVERFVGTPDFAALERSIAKLLAET